jgi:hypothetical protein
VLEHGFGLVIKAAVLQGADEIAYGFAFNADIWCEDVVANGKLAGKDLNASSMQKRREGAAEFSNVDYHGRWSRCCCKPSATGNAGVDGSKELFLRILHASIVS